MGYICAIGISVAIFASLKVMGGRAPLERQYQLRFDATLLINMHLVKKLFVNFSQK